MRTAVVGLGFPGRQHLAGYLADSRCEVVYVCDPDRARVGDVLYDPRIVVVDRAEDIPEVEALSIATPTNTHAELIALGTERSAWVVCEKPLVRSLEELIRLEQQIGPRSSRVIVAANRRFRPEATLCKQLIAHGAFGRIERIELRWIRSERHPLVRGWYLDPALAGGGALIDLGWHLADLLVFLAAPAGPVRIGAWVDPHAPESHAVVNLRAEAWSGIIEASWWLRGVKSDDVEILLRGADGALRLRGNFKEAPRILERDIAPKYDDVIEAYLPMIGKDVFQDSFRALIEAVLATPRPGLEAPLPGWADARMTTELLSAAYRTARGASEEVMEFASRGDDLV